MMLRFFIIVSGLILDASALEAGAGPSELRFEVWLGSRLHGHRAQYDEFKSTQGLAVRVMDDEKKAVRGSHWVVEKIKKPKAQVAIIATIVVIFMGILSCLPGLVFGYLLGLPCALIRWCWSLVRAMPSACF